MPLITADGSATESSFTVECKQTMSSWRRFVRNCFESIRACIAAPDPR